MKEESCYFCKESKEIGKDLFWCPRLRTYVSAKSYYGHWVCLDCCKNSFFKNIFSKHLEHRCSGMCAECDFPVGSILWIKKIYGKPSPEYRIGRRARIVRDKELHAELKIDKNEFAVHPLSLSSLNYYGFKWEASGLRLVSRQILDGIGKLVLICKRLPVRKIIVLEDTLTFGCLSWGELCRYYWNAHGSPQHFKEEEWMDDTPVIILASYLNEDGINLDKNALSSIAYLKDNELKNMEVAEEKIEKENEDDKRELD